VQDNEVGGATVYFGGRGTVLDSVFRNNRATTTDGGAISGVSALTIRNSVFFGNAAKGKGGAIHHSAYDDGQSAPNGGGLLLENCLLHQNTAAGDGGAVYATAGSLPATTPGPVIRGCTLANNSAKNGGAVYLYAGVAMSLRDSIFWANNATQEGAILALRNDVAVTANIERCLLSDKEEAVYDPAFVINGSGYTLGTLGNFSADPLFVGSGDDPFLLSQILAGQAVNSPAVEPAGGQAAGLVSWGSRTTRTDGMPDSGLLDYGWHAPVP
jgi:predicted outer membrane repeat protein